MDRMNVSTGPLANIRVLVVEDDPDLLHSIREALVHDYRVTACVSGHEALQAMAEGQRFDVLVTALRLLDMDARTLLDGIEEHDATLRRNALLIAEQRLSIEDEEFVDEGHARVMFAPLRPLRLRQEVEALAIHAARLMLAI